MKPDSTKPNNRELRYQLRLTLRPTVLSSMDARVRKTVVVGLARLLLSAAEKARVMEDESEPE